MIRTLLFFDLILTKEKQSNFLDTVDNLQDKVEKFSNNLNEDELLYTNENVIIQIESCDKDHLFGSYGRTENPGNKQLMRGRTKEDYKVTNLESLKELIESYTYFYLDLNKNECIILNNYRCKGFQNEFPKFLILHFRLSSIYKDIMVVNKLSEKINEDISKSNHFARISYTYTSDKLPSNEFLNFKEMSGLEKEQIRTASVQLYLEPELNYKDNASLLSNTSEYIDNFSTFTIETEEETIDVIEKVLSKKVSINIDEDDINNLYEIKNILQSHLLSY